jgi:predicted DNA-binding protein
MTRPTFDDFINRTIVRKGLVPCTFQINAEQKETVDRIAAALNRSTAEVYRELISASLPDMEHAVSTHLELRQKAKR